MENETASQALTVAARVAGLTLVELAIAAVSAESGDEEVQKYYQEQVEALLVDATKDKVDAYSRVITYLMIEAATQERRAEAVMTEEVERIQMRAKRIRAEADKRRRWALQAMAVLKTERLEGHTSALVMRRSPPSVDSEGYDETRVPAEFKRAEFKIEVPLQDVEQYELLHPPTMCDCHDEDRAVDGYAFPIDIVKITHKVDKHALLAGLKQPCPTCGGMTEVEGEPCVDCGAKGTVRIAGAKLLADKRRLEVG